MHLSPRGAQRTRDKILPRRRGGGARVRTGICETGICETGICDTGIGETGIGEWNEGLLP